MLIYSKPVESFLAVDECSSSRKCTDHMYTLIGLKCQSMRSKVQCTNKTLHKSRKKREGSRESACSVYAECDNLKTSVATTDAIFDCHDSSGNLVQKSYCTSRRLTLYPPERNMLSFFLWAAYLLFSGSNCKNNFLFVS